MTLSLLTLYLETESYCHCLVPKWCLTLCDPWAIAYQALLSMGFPKQEYWSGLPLCSSGDLPNPGIKKTKYLAL